MTLVLDSATLGFWDHSPVQSDSSWAEAVQILPSESRKLDEPPVPPTLA
jgi:hypothetical protein